MLVFQVHFDSLKHKCKYSSNAVSYMTKEKLRHGRSTPERKTSPHNHYSKSKKTCRSFKNKSSGFGQS
jgi:hypothetical protein